MGIRGRRYITASSSWDRYHAAWRARLLQRVTGRYRGGWSARRNNRRQYIQFDLRRPFRVVKVVTQGRYDARQWVTTFVISYSQDKYRWIRYKHYGRVKVMFVMRYIFFSPWSKISLPPPPPPPRVSVPLQCLILNFKDTQEFTLLLQSIIKDQHMTLRCYGKPKGNIREIGEFKLYVYGKRQF